jgi:hypothetical protein
MSQFGQASENANGRGAEKILSSRNAHEGERARGRAQPRALGTVAKLRSTADRSAVEPPGPRRMRVSLFVSAEEQREVAMRQSSKLVGALATVGLASVLVVSACKSSDQSPEAPGEKTPALSRPAPQGSMPASPERNTGDTAAPKSGY